MGTWIIRGMNGKEELAEEFEKINTDLLTVTETKKMQGNQWRTHLNLQRRRNKSKSERNLLRTGGPNKGAIKQEIGDSWKFMQEKVDAKVESVIIIEDLNGRVGNDPRISEGTVGKCGETATNSNGQNNNRFLHPERLNNENIIALLEDSDVEEGISDKKTERSVHPRYLLESIDTDIIEKKCCRG
ncbi:hypothetical protein ILUMI_01685 [Ignelater luminosus]|uniref:Uncharacterized protein n=1 Tax=Ignelater luminosus TaxID=2038154 RepID=A0A8K0DDY1_IGNLU|nr:hypothetical protein ILUMI_01685 [Ignelater luminosus]